MLIFITGGVRSGKSTFAEKLAAERSKTNTLHYVATSLRSDIEMIDRINRHVKRRKKSSANWKTWEIQRNMNHLHEQIENFEVLLFDCLTTYVNNNLFRLKNGNYVMLNETERKQLCRTIESSFQQLQQNRTLIVVSNEIFFDSLFYKNEATFVYVQFLGKLHQRIVRIADEAYLCENGIPLRMK